MLTLITYLQSFLQNLYYRVTRSNFEGQNIYVVLLKNQYVTQLALSSKSPGIV